MPTRLPPGKAFHQTVAANVPDDDQEQGEADNTGQIAGRTTQSETGNSFQRRSP